MQILIHYGTCQQYLKIKQVTIMTAELSEMIKGLKNSYDSLKEPAVSVAYCTLKFGLIEQNAVIIQNAIGAKPR